MNSSTQITKQILLDAPIDRVWDALTDSRKFGEWFRVKLDQPFKLGTTTTGHITYPGYEHLKWQGTTQRLDGAPDYVFSFTWHPYAIDPDKDYSLEPPTLVEFSLHQEPDERVKLIVVESGFEKIPQDRRDEAIRMNDGGWAEQMKNIAAYLDQV